MAITKLLAIKESHGRGTKPSDHLRRNIFYICNPKKTQDGTWVESNAGATPYEIYQNMMLNKQNYGKTTKRQGYHYVITNLRTYLISIRICIPMMNTRWKKWNAGTRS